MTVGGPESRAEEHELSCVQFSQIVYRQQNGTVCQQRWRQCRPGTQDVDSASGQRSAAPGQRQSRSRSPTRLANSTSAWKSLWLGRCRRVTHGVFRVLAGPVAHKAAWSRQLIIMPPSSLGVARGIVSSCLLLVCVCMRT